MNELKQESIGDRIVGLSFNPSSDPKVQEVKEKFSSLINMLMEDKEISMEAGVYTSIKAFLIEHALGELLNAQMNLVKVLTYK